MPNYKLVNADQLDVDMKSVADKIREEAELSNQLEWPSGFIDGIDQCSSLNFTVVGGTTQPSNPKENTIWVNTSTNITGWVFSADQPSNPTNGMVWIKTGASSGGEFNALKKNAIQVYPLSAKQYVNRAWKDVTAKSYQGGEWVDWIIHLYNKGDECADITGGWTAKGMEFAQQDRCYPANATVTYNNNQMVITMPANYQTGVVWTSENIDLTEIQTLTFTGYKTGYAYFGCKFIVVPETASYWSGNAVAQIDISGTNSSVHLDVSSITGTYRVGIGICTDAPSAGDITVYVDEIFGKTG